MAFMADDYQRYMQEMMRRQEREIHERMTQERMSRAMMVPPDFITEPAPKPTPKKPPFLNPKLLLVKGK